MPFRSDADMEAAVAVVSTHLEHGRLLAYPTETIYGLGSRAVEADVESLARLKGRREGKPFLLLISHRAMAERHGLQFSRAARALADRFWPGPLTLVLPGGEGDLPASLRGPEGGIAVRWTSHTGMAYLIGHLDQPMTSTSANRPGQPTAPGSGAIVTEFGAAVEDGTLLVLDGGVLGNLPPSTVVDCTQPLPRMIRDGAVPLRDLRGAVGSLAP
ncbi:MAG: L-threonylcarbamoyladenylate synthase [Gemmatimonadota bacterium]